MLRLVLGGSGNGKSTYAEKILDKYTENKYYIATMRVYDDEAREKVARHIEKRKGRNFYTIECIGDVYTKSKKYINEKSIVLLECLPNLVADEMFVEDRFIEPDKVYEKILGEIELINQSVKEFVIVSNNVFDDGVTYDIYTEKYISTLGQLNCKIAEMADEVLEVVAGIPLYHKKEDISKLVLEDKMGIRLYIGGKSQGKTKYVEEIHKDEKENIFDDFHLWVRDELLNGKNPEEDLNKYLENHDNPIFVAAEVGSGIIPIDSFERRYREVSGRLVSYIASRAEKVVRIYAGIPQVLK